MAYPIVIQSYTETPAFGQYPLSVAFTVVATTGGQPVRNATYLWDFGDGLKSTEPSPTHLYLQPGTFVPSVTISGNDNYDNSFTTITQALTAIQVSSWGSTYNSIDGSRCSKCYVYGTDKKQGIGFTENTGADWPIVEAEVGSVEIVDDQGFSHTIFHDVVDGYDYDITPRDGPAGSGIVDELTDKATTVGSGAALVPSARFKGDKGTFEHYFMDLINARLYTRPMSDSLRSETGYDANGYPTGLNIDFNIYADNEQITESVSAKDIVLPKQEWLFGKNTKGNHTIQAEIVANMAGFQIVGKMMEFDQRDIPTDPQSRKMSEATYQANLNNTLVAWLTRNKTAPGFDLISKSNPAVACTVLAGPNSCYSGFRIPAGQHLHPYSGALGAYTVIGWYDAGATITGTTISALGTFQTSGTWTLGAWSVIPIGGVITNLAIAGDWADVRVLGGVKVWADVQYLYDDTTKNSGRNTLPRNYKTSF